MDNSLAAGRRLATTVILVQAMAALLVGALCLAKGTDWALAALGGGLVTVVGSALLALRVFRPQLARGAVTLQRFALGILLKWLVVLGGLFVLLVRLRLPLVPVLLGAGAAVAVNWLALRFTSR